ncbi:MAG: response regulator [Verrucomicrobiota bacterium]
MSKILIIDDDESLLRAMRITLEKRGHEIFEASNGRDGIRVADTNELDLVVSDIVMPEVEGLETIRALRHKFPSLPIIGVSGAGRSGMANYLEMAAFMGAVRTLRKPFELCEFRDAIASVLEMQNSAAD